MAITLQYIWSTLYPVEIATSSVSGAGISQRYRAALERLHRDASAAFDVADAARILDLDRAAAAELLGYLARRGWLSRVRRGLYVAVPLNARRSGEWIEDPWIIADRVFAPCYIGGWSASEHWDFTEQLFRTVLVVSGRNVRASDNEVQGQRFHVVTRAPDMIFGTSTVWRQQVKVQVSDPSRTIVDILDSPRIGGGIRHCSAALHEYLRSPHRDDGRLVDYGDRLGNRSIFKRLGYLLELREMPDTSDLIDACRDRRSSGFTALDPANAAKGHLSRRWGLRINVALGTDDAA